MLCILGCGAKNQMVGTWNGLGQPLELKADLTYTLGKNKGIWSRQNDHIHLQPTSIDGHTLEEARAQLAYISEKEPARKEEMDKYEKDVIEPTDLRISTDGNIMFKVAPDGGQMTINRQQ